MSIKKTGIVLLIIGVILLASPVNARKKVLPVTRIEQPGKDCWAASIAMVVCYYAGGCSPGLAQKVVWAIHEISGVPKGVSAKKLSDFEKFIWDKYFLSIDLDPDYHLTWSDVVNEIDSGRPLIAMLDVSDIYPGEQGGHVVVIAGYAEYDGSRWVYVIDPGYVLPRGSDWYVWTTFKKWLVDLWESWRYGWIVFQAIKTRRR